MKQLFFTLFLFHFSISFSQKKCERIAFYNIENLFDTIDNPHKNDNEFLPTAKRNWNQKRYEKKLKDINQVLDSLKHPMILGLCEVENNKVLKDLIDVGSMKEHYEIVHFESLDQRGIDNAILYDKTKSKLLNSGKIRFDLLSPDSKTRDIVWGEFLIASDTIIVMVNHWPSRRGGQLKSEPKRLIAAYAAKNFIDSITQKRPDVEIIFMGDLNDHPENKAPKIISEKMRPMITKKSGKYGGSHNYRGEWGVLDHIMVSNNALKKEGFYVCKKSGTIYSPHFILTTYKENIVPKRMYGGLKYLGGYSDHLPVFINVAIAK